MIRDSIQEPGNQENEILASWLLNSSFPAPDGNRQKRRQPVADPAFGFAEWIPRDVTGYAAAGETVVPERR
jgi:hypothetical protein